MHIHESETLPSQNTGALVVSPAAAMTMLSCGRTRLYELLDRDELESFLDGRARRITVASIRAYITRKLAASRKTAA